METTENNQGTIFQQTSAATDVDTIGALQTQVSSFLLPPPSGFTFPPPMFYSHLRMVGPSLSSLLYLANYSSVGQLSELLILPTPPTTTLNLGYVLPPSWEVVNDLMRQVKYLAVENEKGRQERAFLRKALSISLNTHVGDDARVSMSLNP